ncbi:MAG TPA: L-seryl-tRNA(Sec) selenium transferase [Candidatus Binatia bacterium]|nr:L-seryl-tRNA(Sec) selenium transferase [Candidatus Binatia bacterium]
MAEKSKALRGIPAVEQIVQRLGKVDLPRPAVVAVVRREIAALRKEKQIPDPDAIFERIRRAIAELRSARIQPVINGTGVLIHTNLGRAPLGAQVIQTLATIGTNYNNLEFDLGGGERGGRAAYLEHNLALLCGAEAATVVNNCAAALVLILRHFAKPPRDEVVISRGELIQIGGGFRIPEILEASGARLREIGTTNKTSLSDYTKAIRRETALVLKVHRSNFFMSGFVDSPATEEIAALAHKHRVPFVEDLGSGAIIATEKLAPIEHEPTPAEVLKRGVDLVCFSGDKLLAGPQAGIIAGKQQYVLKLKREPFFRALRCDKLILSALQTTVDSYLAGESNALLEMLQTPIETLRSRAEKIISELKTSPLKITIGHGKSQLGGGTLPRSTIPSVTLDITPDCPLAEFAARLRSASPPIIGYVSADKYKLDLRTIFPHQDPQIVAALVRARPT